MALRRRDGGRIGQMQARRDLMSHIVSFMAKCRGLLCPSLHDDQPRCDLPKKPNSDATYAARRGAGTTRKQRCRHQARTFSIRISERLDAAPTWDDLT